MDWQAEEQTISGDGTIVIDTSLFPDGLQLGLSGIFDSASIQVQRSIDGTRFFDEGAAITAPTAALIALAPCAAVALVTISAGSSAAIVADLGGIRSKTARHG